MSIARKRLKVEVRTLAVISIMVIACSTAGDSTDSAKAAASSDTGAASVSLVSGGPKGLIGPPGADAAGTIDYMKHIDFGKDVEKVSGFVDDFDCPTCTKSPVKLMVMPEKMAFKVDWPTALVNRENEGWIVARITNVDPSGTRYEPLDIDKDSSAYQWVGPITPDGLSRAVAFYRIDATTGHAGNAMSPVTTVGYCDDKDWTKRTHGVARRKHPGTTPCIPKTYAPPGGVMLAGPPAHPPGGTWLSCAGGCCEVTDLTRMPQDSSRKQ